LVRGFLDSDAALTFPRRVAASDPNDELVADSARAKGDVVSDAFYGACRNGHTAVAKLLLERGADVNAKGVLGGTGLHWTRRTPSPSLRVSPRKDEGTAVMPD
jgi:hypothetical protein